MSKAARTRRARARIDERLWSNREKPYDLELWQIPEWNIARLKMLDKFEKSRDTLYKTPEQYAHFHFFYKQLIHKGGKP